MWILCKSKVQDCPVTFEQTGKEDVLKCSLRTNGYCFQNYTYIYINISTFVNKAWQLKREVLTQISCLHRKLGSCVPTLVVVEHIYTHRSRLDFFPCNIQIFFQFSTRSAVTGCFLSSSSPFNMPLPLHPELKPLCKPTQLHPHECHWFLWMSRTKWMVLHCSYNKIMR